MSRRSSALRDFLLLARAQQAGSLRHDEDEDSAES
jgi:hypothetical protein